MSVGSSLRLALAHEQIQDAKPRTAMQRAMFGWALVVIQNILHGRDDARAKEEAIEIEVRS